MKTSKKTPSGRRSIKIRIAAALILLVVLEGTILIGAIFFTGVLHKNDVATYDIIVNQSKSRKKELQNLFNNKRKNITDLSLALSVEIGNILSGAAADTPSVPGSRTSRGIPAGSLINAGILDAGILDAGILDAGIPDAGILDAVLDHILTELINFTKYNPVTGAFAILDFNDVAAEVNELRECLYIRDASPGLTVTGNTDLLLEYGRADMARQRGLALNYLWTRDMDYQSVYDRDFYFNPVRAVLAEGDSDNVNMEKIQIYGYWNPTFMLKKDDVSVITYSLPLILGDGRVIGVVGFELNLSYISNSMPASEIPYERGVYLIGIDNGGGLCNEGLISSGAYAKQFFSGPPSTINFKIENQNDKGSIYEITNSNNPHVKSLGAYNEIELYESASPFVGEVWSFICMAPREAVLAGSNDIRNAIVFSIVTSILMALVISTLVIIYISNPINKLSAKVMLIDPANPVRFEKTGITEIDELSGAFEVLSDGISQAAERMFKIIELVNIPLGSFEINIKEDRVYISNFLFGLAGFSCRMGDPGADEDGLSRNSGGNRCSVTVSEWRDFIGSLTAEVTTGDSGAINEALYQITKNDGERRWLKIRMLKENMCDIGIVMDVTEEIVQKQRLEFEKNFDPLTKLYNRHAFAGKAYELVRSAPDKIGLMMFADLDDLKYVNDTYGHETGDSYITAFADFLGRFKACGGIAGRESGDEFVMFMGGFETRDEARGAFDSIFSKLREEYIFTPDGSTHKLRVSVGISYYPQNSSDVKELIKCADFAMYEIKHTIKGEVKEFNSESYNKNAFVINKKNILNLFIEERRVRFAFQPIVDTATGEIYAYEALMRSMVRELKSPDDILRVARSQSKLYQIEKLTFEVIFEWIEKNSDALGSRKVFINTIPSQIFTEADMNEIGRKFGHMFDRAVFEVTENEFSDKSETKNKMDVFKNYGSMVAIDDYGSGYSNEGSLLFINPDFLKVDRSIVQDIDRNADKLQLMQNIIAYAKRKRIRIIAEGVETAGEMRVLVNSGVDYIQGYYFAKPEFELCEINEEARINLLERSERECK